MIEKANALKDMEYTKIINNLTLIKKPSVTNILNALDMTIKTTSEYIEGMTKDERKKYGQFFTGKETAEYMASLFDLDTPNIANKRKLTILDPGAGTGILSIALIERLESYEYIKCIELTCYETDEKVLDILRENLEFTKQRSRIVINYKIITENYITSQSNDFNHNNLLEDKESKKFDLIIGNPPYMKIGKDAPEALTMPEVCYGAPNMYFLFTAMSLFNLKADSEMVYIIPRSWTSGAYFKRFRKYLFKHGVLTNIHLFISRNKVFNNEDVLQETIIIKVKKTTEKLEEIIISSSNSSNDFDDVTYLNVPYDLVISGEEYYVYLVTTEAEVDVLEALNKWTDTLPSLGLKMKTGLTVDFRNREVLRDEPEEGTMPFFYSQHIKDGKIQFPIGKEGEYILTSKEGLLQLNKNYLFIKRFTAKEEKRRLQCGIYLASEYNEYEKISTHNKINFIDKKDGSMSKELVYGLYVIFNSRIYDIYYRILNGSTQVNSTEVNNMPMPPINIIEEMGRELINSDNLTEETCNRIMEGYCGR